MRRWCPFPAVLFLVSLALAAGCGGGGGGGSSRGGGSHGAGAGATTGGTSGGTSGGGSAIAHPLRAGVAVGDITPPVGVPLGGFGEGPRRLSFPDLDPFNWNTLLAQSTGVRDPLLCKAIVLDDGQDRVAIVTLDFIATGAQAMDKVFARLQGRAAIPPENILVCSSHTHSGPGTLTPLHFWEIAAMDFYQPQLLDPIAVKIADTIVAAEAALEDAQLGVGTGQLTGITKNRRVGVSPTATPGDIDPTLGVIRIDRADGTPLATIYNYAIHGLVFWWDNMEFSADIMGDTSRWIEAQGGGTGLFCNGAEGDINPDVGHGDQASLAAAAIFGQAVMNVRSGIVASRDCDLKSAAEVYDMGTPTLDLSTGRLGNGIPSALQPIVSFLGGVGIAIPLGSDFMDHEYRFQAIRINNAVIASVPGEPLHALGFEIKQAGTALGYDPAFVFALANGHMAYIAPEPEYWAGGYEGLATLFGPSTARVVKDECARLMGAVR